MVQMVPMSINADLGEGFTNDEALLQTVTHANIACGVYDGDAMTMLRTCRLAKHYGVAIGAHPSYSDRAGFGRRSMELAPDEIAARAVAVVRDGHVASRYGSEVAIVAETVCIHGDEPGAAIGQHVWDWSAVAPSFRNSYRMPRRTTRGAVLLDPSRWFFALTGVYCQSSLNGHGQSAKDIPFERRLAEVTRDDRKASGVTPVNRLKKRLK